MNNKWTFDEHKDGKPKYLALVDALESDVAAGKWQPGDRLPSNRELGTMFNVTVGTVSKAMSEAVRRGIVDTRVGSGTYVRGAARAAAEVDTGSGKVFDLALNTLPTNVVKDFLQAVLDIHTTPRLAREIFSYSLSYNSSRHQALGAKWLAELGTPTEPDNVLLTAGVHQGLIAAFQTLLKPGATAVCETLTYTGIKRIADYRGVTLAGAGSDESGLIPDEVDRKLRETGAKVLVVTTSLQNPTTASLTFERRQQLVTVCRKNEAYIVEDGVNIPLAGDGLPSVAALAPERTIHLTGFSKCIASGFRLGYAAMPAPLLTSFHEALMGAQWIGPGFFAELVATMYADGVVERCISQHRAEAAHRQNLVREFFSNVKIGKSPCYHAWIDAPSGMSSNDFCAQASDAGVKVSAAHHFAVGSADQLPEGYRVSLGACETRSELTTALRKLALLAHQRETFRVTMAPVV